MDQDAAVAGVLDQALDFVSSALEENAALQTKIAELTNKLSSQDKIVLEKVASFDDASLSKALTRLVELQVINTQQMEKIAAEIKENPNRMCDLLTKVSEVLTSAPTEGCGVAKEGSTDPEDDPDPDGWEAMAKGQTVRIKR